MSPYQITILLSLPFNWISLKNCLIVENPEIIHQKQSKATANALGQKSDLSQAKQMLLLQFITVKELLGVGPNDTALRAALKTSVVKCVKKCLLLCISTVQGIERCTDRNPSQEPTLFHQARIGQGQLHMCTFGE